MNTSLTKANSSNSSPKSDLIPLNPPSVISPNYLFNPPDSYCSELTTHTSLMLKKNFLLFSRTKLFTLFILSTPILSCLLLSSIQFLCDHYSASFVNLNPHIVSLNDPLHRCVNPDDCLTIGYSILTKNSNSSEPEYIKNIINDIAYSNELVLERDVRLISIGNYDSYVNYIEKHVNKTEYGILFCMDSFIISNVSIPCQYEYKVDQEGKEKEMFFYTIMYNVSNSPNSFLLMPDQPSPTDSRLTKLKISVDNAYLNHFNNKTGNRKNNSINVELQSYPMTQNRLYQNTDIEGSGGSFYFFFPPMFCFVFFLLEIIREKDTKLRKSLLIIGLNNTSFWLSWFITGVIFSFIITILLIILGYIFQYQVFMHTPFLINFMLYFLFSISMVIFAFFLSTILKTLKSGYTVSYSFILIGLVMEAVMSDYLVIYSLYNIDLPWWVSPILFILNLYPPFNFSKAFDDIATKAAPKFSYDELRWVDGTEYTWTDLFKRIKGKTALETEYNVPPTYQSLLWMLANMVIFAILTWYFDNVDESNKGKTVSYYFCFDKQYWLGTKRTTRFIKLVEESNEINVNDADNKEGIESVRKEREKVIAQEEQFDINNSDDNNNNELNGISIIGASKDYYLNKTFFCQSKTVLHALKPTYLHIPFGELFTLLGHNGAGKSTLLNILTGNLSPTGGNAKIGSADLSTGLYSLIGLCPQHDILWDELTAREHIQLYCKLRSKLLSYNNIDYKEEVINDVITDKLTSVNLLNVADDRVGTYSGGMKRRLSILLSTIGNQKVIFLDEPTTGLDPVNRRFIWKMIQELKSNLAIILTTHSMAEADFLSDRIGVIKDGEMKCIGTPMELKEMYGSGYLITFVTELEHKEYVENEIKKLMPNGKILNSKGGNIMINIPFNKLNEMKYLIYIMNEEYDKYEEIKQLKGYIKECGMNYTTIEEIFLKITKKNDENEERDIRYNN